MDFIALFHLERIGALSRRKCSIASGERIVAYFISGQIIARISQWKQMGFCSEAPNVAGEARDLPRRLHLRVGSSSDEVTGHSPHSILVHHGSDRLDRRFLVLKGGLELDHDVDTLRRVYATIHTPPTIRFRHREEQDPPSLCLRSVRGERCR